MIVDAKASGAYHWMAATILPRPIAWVATENPNGTANLAPFSFFTGASASPPTCIICVSRTNKPTAEQPQVKGPSRKKDTWANIERTGEYVINVVPDALADAMNATSREVPHGTDEFELAGVTKEPSERVRPPRVAESPVALECRLHKIVEVGNAGDETAIIVGEILLWRIHDDMLLENGRLDPAKLDLVGRMGGNWYSRTRDRFELARPKP
ncbi:MAG TPA: flavin reductase family protein [Polyangia bacterium]|nr:flavin reductase family protein [Polyangia bacterium]